MRIDSSYFSNIDMSFAQNLSKTTGEAADLRGGQENKDFELDIKSLRSLSNEYTSTRMEFKIHDETKRVMVRIVDRITSDVIAEIPPEKFLDLLAGLWKQAGLIVDEKA
ncbi:hypothetical protein TSYNTROPHJE_01740 [Tepidanaerobacter syntrophicus]|uniref:flagellar protein FlaG n=1 Tax=Tepidanaerobacter syntrophicus TaxID=224999 RepID=UPI0022EF3CF1|nr:flagellar protein FlaG [Tepidanaerobacter syntrophicus]GLI18361.1 hypothetical protein TSYNTROPHJE_01740 [Tepidanaerobacter syntrophicus]